MTVEEICKEAGFTREAYPDLYDSVSSDIQESLDALMSRLSATMGLTWKRVEIYAKQERVFIDDLKHFVATGQWRDV